MNRTLVLILILILSAVGLVALSINNKPQSATTMTPPVSIAQSTLYLTTPRASSSGTFASDIIINTNSNKVTAAQIELSYNPNDISISDITAGSFFQGPAELLKKIDPANGRVSYAVGVGLGQKGILGQGVTATITFTKLKTAGITQIDFLAKSLVSAEGVAQSVLKSTLGTKLDLSTVYSTPSAK